MRWWLLLVAVAAAGIPAAAPSGTVGYELTIAAPHPSKPFHALFTLDTETGKRQLLGSVIRGVTQHRWSADGTRVAYRARMALWVANADGSAARRLVSDSDDERASFGSAVWSRDEGRIVFNCSRRPGLARICSVPAEGGQLSTVIAVAQPPGSAFEELDVSRRDGALVLTREAGATWFRWDLLTARADGTGLRQLVSLYIDEKRGVAWSPDGETIAYAHCASGNRQLLRLMREDGTNKRTLRRFNGYRRCPEWITWSPDGERLAFRSGTGIWLVNADGSGLKLLTTSRYVGGIAWRSHR
jgi:Tol biopolymer transport system component